MTPGFVAAVLDGFEGTLEAVLERLDEGGLKLEVEDLQAQIASKRQPVRSAGSYDASHGGFVDVLRFRSAPVTGLAWSRRNYQYRSGRVTGLLRFTRRTTNVSCHKDHPLAALEPTGWPESKFTTL